MELLSVPTGLWNRGLPMLHQAGLPPSFWGEALAAFIHVWNKTPTSTLPGMTPYQAFLGSKPDVSML
jgi:hypothetical protein